MYCAAVGVDAVFGALSDGVRRRLCEILRRDGEQTVTELLAHFDISQPAVSRHLRVLREAGLVRAEARGRTRCYRLHPDAFAPAHAWLTVQGFWNGRLDALSGLLDEQAAPDERGRP